MTGAILAAALAYAERGWQVLPLNWPTPEGCSCQRGGECGSAGKHPWVRWKDKGGSTDPELIRWWWRKRPASNVAILTGDRRSGLWVLDIDPAHGGEDTLAELEQAHSPLPDTLTAVTGSGGRHLVFRYPETTVRQTAGALGPGVDTRSDGGLIVAAPSCHRSGRRYRWANWGTAPADVPSWLLKLLAPAPAAARRPLPPSDGGHTRYAEAALRAEVERVGACPIGAGLRNVTLHTAAIKLGTLVGAGLLADWRAAQALLAASTLPDSEARATILSGLRFGATNPRPIVS